MIPLFGFLPLIKTHKLRQKKKKKSKKPESICFISFLLSPGTISREIREAPKKGTMSMWRLRVPVNGLWKERKGKTKGIELLINEG